MNGRAGEQSPAPQKTEDGMRVKVIIDAGVIYPDMIKGEDGKMQVSEYKPYSKGMELEVDDYQGQCLINAGACEEVKVAAPKLSMEKPKS